MPQRPLVSIVMPAYNSERTLEAAIASVRVQTLSDWELLVVDDASRDRTREILERLSHEDPRVRAIPLATNGGAASARNVGLSVAGGRFVAFLDSDDLWLPDKLERQVAMMLEASCPISFTDYEWVQADAQPTGIVRTAPDRVHHDDLLDGNCIGLSTAMVDTMATGPLAMPVVRLNHDFALWLQLTRAGHEARRLPECLTLYRRHPGSLSANKIESAWTNYRILRGQEGLGIPAALVRIAVWAFHSVRFRLFPTRSPGR